MRIDLFVAVHENPYFPPTLDSEKLLIVEKQMEDVEQGMQRLRCISIDARYYVRAALQPNGVVRDQSVRGSL